MRVADDLKPHNRETIRRILEFYKTERKCCAIQATGTGKTFLILRLLEILNEKGKVAVIFAPNREIIKQTKKRMKKFGLNNATFYTYQKLARMTEEEIFAIEADLIICDELHRTGAKTWGQKFVSLVNSHPESKVFGVTATPLRCADGRDMAEEYFAGNKACDISLAEALVREIIPVMPLYISALYTFEEEYQKMSEKIDKANNSNEEKVELQKELLAAKQQLEKANGVSEIIKKYITNYNGKYIVFCKDIKHLYAMKNVVIGWFRDAGYDGEIFEYPYYSNNSKVKKNLFEFEKNEAGGLKLLFVIDKLNEGLHLDEIDGCILLRTTVSNIIYYQQIGRAIDAGSMNKRVILDLVSNFNSLKSFSLKKDLEEKVRERQSGKFSAYSEDFELDQFEVIDCVQECVDVFSEIDERIVNKYRPWENYELENLKKYFPSMGVKCRKYLNNRTDNCIQAMASKLGIKYDMHLITDEEIEIIKKYYPEMGAKCVKFLPGRNEGTIKTFACKLGIKYNGFWTKEEDEIIEKYYLDIGTDCIKYLPNRSKEQIMSRAERLGIKKNRRSVKYLKWTAEEDKLLIENHQNNDLYDLFDNKTEKQIMRRMYKLGLKRRNSNSSKYKYVSKCNERWRVAFYIGKKYISFGFFETEDEAGRVAMEKAKEYGKAV